MKNQAALFLFLISILFQNQGFAQDFWEVVNTPPEIGIHTVEVNSNGDIFLGVGFSSAGGVLRKLANGNIWDTSLYVNNQVIGTIYIDKYDNIFAADSKLYYSDNNGVSWSNIFTSQIFGITSIFKNSVHSLFVGIWGGIYKSDSVGSSWVQVLSLENTEVVNAIVEDTLTGELYAGTINFIGGGGVYRSINDGDTWEHIGLTDNYVSSLALNSSGDLFAGTRGNQTTGIGGVFILPAGQSEWNNVNDEELVTSLVINSEDTIYIGCSTLDFYWGGVRQSTDNGQTWEDVSSESMYDEDIEKLILGPEEHLYALAYNAVTPLYKSVNSTITSMQDYPVDKGFITYNFPNPFVDETTIKFELPGDYENTVLKIFNISGKSIRQFNITAKKSQQWDGRDNYGNLVKKGVYFYNINYGNISSKLNKILFIN